LDSSCQSSIPNRISYLERLVNPLKWYNYGMGKSSAARLTREEFLEIIENYRNHGRDTAELEQALREAFPSTAGDGIPQVDEMVTELREKSPMTEGICCVCGAEGTLLSGVCETCFLPWATKIAEDRIARMRRNKQREKF
jgi:hypothetical protein